MPETENLMKDQKKLISTAPASDGIRPPRPDYVNLQPDINNNNNNLLISNNNMSNNSNNNNNEMNNNKKEKLIHDDSVFYVNIPQKTAKPVSLTPAPRTRGRLNSGKRPGQQFDQYDDDDDTSNYYELPAGAFGERDADSKYVNVDPRSTRSPKKHRSDYTTLFFSKLLRSSTSSSNSSSSLSSDSTLSPTSSLVHSPTSSLAHSLSMSSIGSRSSSTSAASSDYVRINSHKTTALQRTISEHHRPQREKKKKNKKAL